MGEVNFQNVGPEMTGTDGNVPVTVKPGGERKFPSACSLVRFINANHGVVSDKEGAQSLNEMAKGEGNCPGEQVGTTPAATPAKPPTQPGPGGDSPSQQGAPAKPDATPVARVTVDNPPGDPADKRQPTERFHDSKQPQTSGQISDRARADGGNASDAEDAVKRARRGDPPPGEQRSTHTGDDSNKRSTGADPVDLATGRFALSAVDLEVVSPIMPLEVQRCYLSGRPYWGPWGFNWDHNWNVYLRELTDGRVVRWSGRLHEDVFVPGGGGYEPPRGVFERLEPLPAPQTGYRIRARAGITMLFDRPGGWADAERIPLVEITDRVGHTIALTYGAGDRLAAVRDPDGRALNFIYGTCGLLERVEDHTGRGVDYRHDLEAEHLSAVVLPATSDFPDGHVTHYEYDVRAWHPAFRHNILRVIDHDGRTVVVNRFGEDPSSDDFNRVIEQFSGPHRFAFSYEQVQFVLPDPVFADIVATQTCVSFPDGGLWTYSFNFAGELLDERFRLRRDGSLRVVATQRTFDSQGNLATLTTPDGAQTVWTYDDAAPEPRDRPNLLRVERRAPPTFPEPSRVVLRTRFEPRFQLIREQQIETGETTRATYDFDQNPVVSDRGDIVRIDWPDATLPDGTVQSASTRYEYDGESHLVATISPEDRRDELVYDMTPGTGRGLLREYHADAPGADEVTRLDYDANLFPAGRTDPGGAFTGLHHNALGQLEQLDLPAIDGVVDSIRYRYDADLSVARVERPRGDYTDPVISDAFIADVTVNDALGHTVETVVAANTADPRTTRFINDFRGTPTETTDAAGIRQRDVYDERGLLLSTTQALGTPEEMITAYTYDPAGRLVRTEAPGGRVTRQEYDAWGRIAKVVLPSGTEVRSRYGPLDVLTQREIFGRPAPGTPPRVLQRVRWDYDERARMVRTTVEAFIDDPATAVDVAEERWHDRDGLVVRRVAPQAATWIYDYDGRGRQVKETDPQNDVVKTDFGADSLPAQLTTKEIGPFGSITRWVTYEHDARRRVKRVTTSAGLVTETDYDARDYAIERREGAIRTTARYGVIGELLEQVDDAGGLDLTSQYAYDPLGRGLAFEDPIGQITSTVRDALGRPRVLTLPDGAVHTQTYDGAGDLVQLVGPDGSLVEMVPDAVGRVATLKSTPGPGRALVPDHQFGYDGLDRIVSATAGADVVTRQYDSLGRLIADDTNGVALTRSYDDAAAHYDLMFPDDRQERHFWDGLGRVARIELRDPGTSPLAALAGAAGDELASYEYLGRARIARNVHANATESRWLHDDEGRLTEVEHRGPGGAVLEAVRYRYDELTRRRVRQLEAAPEANDVFHYDSRRRLTEWRSEFPLGSLSGTPAAGDIAAADAAAAGATLIEAYDLDPADRRWQVTRTAGGVPSVIPYTYDADGLLSQVGGDAVTHDVDGMRTSDGVRSIGYDALGRATALLDAAGATTLATLGYDPLGRISKIDSGGVTRRIHYLGTVSLQEDAPAGAIVQRTHNPLLLCPSLELRSGGRLSLHGDGHESLVLACDDTGAAAERFRYEPFGTATIHTPAGVLLPASALGLAPVFGGMELLGAAGLYLTPRRLYDPATGLFVARDPFLHLQSPNAYLFSRGDPVLGLDPTGEIVPWLAAGLVVGAIGAVTGIAAVVIRGGNYDGKDIAAAALIGFGAGFIAGATFGAASTWAGGLMLPAAGGAAATATGGATTGGLGVSIASGAFGGLVSGGASGAFSGFAGGSYSYARGRAGNASYGDYVGQRVFVESVSGAVGGVVGGAMFGGLARAGTVPQGLWAALRRGPTPAELRAVMARAVVSPYGLGAPAMGASSGFTSGTTRNLLEGEDLADAAEDAVDDAYIGMATMTLSTAAHPTSWRYWGARVSPRMAAEIQAARAGSAHHQNNVAQYPELATSRPNTTKLSAFWRWYGNNIIAGNIEGPFSDYNDPASPLTHDQMHGLWRFGQSGNYSNWASHGPWKPAWNVANVPVDPRAQNDKSKPAGGAKATAAQ